MSQNQKHFKEILSDFNNAMLVTLDQNHQPSARPMRIADVTDEGEVWFATDKASGKVDEIKNNSVVGITLQSGSKFLSLTGTATVFNDRSKVEQLWSEPWKIWFPKGKNDPSLTLLKIEPDEGEFWDLSGTNRLRYLYEAGKAYFQGNAIDNDAIEGISAKVNF